MGKYGAGHVRAVRTMYRTPPRSRRTLGRHWRRAGPGDEGAADDPARHIGVADAAAAYASAGVCVVAAGILAWGIAGLGRAVYADVGRKTRGRAAEFGAAAAECAREWKENDCGGRVSTSAVGRMCRDWGACMERGKWAEWDAVSGVVWAEAVSECGRAFVEGAGGMTGVFTISCSLLVLVVGLNALWRWFSGSGETGARSGRSWNPVRRVVGGGEFFGDDKEEWTEVVDDFRDGEEEDVSSGYAPQRLLLPARGYGGCNKALLTPRRATTVSISRRQVPAAHR